MRNLQGGMGTKTNNASTYRNTAIDNQGSYHGLLPEADVDDSGHSFTSGAADLTVCSEAHAYSGTHHPVPALAHMRR